ncbi:aldo/keto reductase [Rhizobium mongolense]|uniref:Aryl-alcohol dehydrogenase-like predicted oxidoreductase n=1 Tax=Rhizobium mongolense TaxID=57676 RepID=A0A7W6RVZ0_9HYPH|nr:aldo/keto reductase [Rhizobium mongolense]MBB4279091.1 aryl-alcohol dehydrogenase-like predicted oxidoreductase [Rhizobium mongolense]
MKYNTLGNTGLYVSELCLGTMTFGGKGTWANMGNVQQDDAQALIARALEHGINFIDTADIYSSGTSEEMIGQSLKNLGVRREDVVIATKVYRPMGQGPNDAGNSRGHIFDSVKASLRRLQVDHIDLYQLHNVDNVLSVARIALAWLRHQPHVASVIVGAKTLTQLDDSIGASEITLSADEVAELEAVSRIAPEYPAWMQRTREVAARPPLGKPINAIE